MTEVLQYYQICWACRAWIALPEGIGDGEILLCPDCGAECLFDRANLVAGKAAKQKSAVSLQSNPLDLQIGGNHYKKYKIQPAEYIHANSLDWFQGNIVKYITRFRDKNGREDLEKIIHYVQMLIELEYPQNEP